VLVACQASCSGLKDFAKERFTSGASIDSPVVQHTLWKQPRRKQAEIGAADHS